MGEVVALKEETWSDQVDVYCAQPYWRERGVLTGGRLRMYGTAREARVAAEVMARRYLGAAAWVTRASLSSDWWSAEKVLFAGGDVPAFPLSASNHPLPTAAQQRRL